MKTTKTEKTAIGLSLYTAVDLVGRAFTYMVGIEWDFMEMRKDDIDGWLFDVALLVTALWPGFTLLDNYLEKRSPTPIDPAVEAPVSSPVDVIPYKKPAYPILPGKTQTWLWGANSLRHRKHVQPILNEIWDEVLVQSVFDIGITSGRRDLTEQQHNVATEASPVGTLTKEGMSRHMGVLSYATDFIVYDANGKYVRDSSTHENYMDYYRYIADLAIKIAARKGIKLVWGGNWKSRDAGHIHLTEDQFPFTEADYAMLDPVTEIG